MKILFGEEWLGNFPDYPELESSRVLDVNLWIVLSPVKNMYFVPAKSPRLLLNYLREVGPIEVTKKVLSRIKERYRNDKYISVGIGTDNSSSVYAFVATCHPKAVSKVAINKKLTFKLEDFLDSNALQEETSELKAIIQKSQQSSMVLYLNYLDRKDYSPLLPLQSWSDYSGVDPYSLVSKEALISTVKQAVCSAALFDTQSFSKEASELCDHDSGRAGKTEKKKGILFGYGQYAKTNILPNIGHKVEILRIHEVDPTQIPISDKSVDWSTDPVYEGEQEFDVHFIAGYHHTHSDLAITALSQNNVAVVEKPLVVNQTQLDELLSEYRRSQGAVYACFHKRYSALNELALRDLQVAKNPTPINYHCIVYEVSLPQYHWYNWPNSHTRVVSNACHWIDHFLFLNGYPEVKSIEGHKTKDGTVNCTIECETGAVFTMLLTDIGSSRIGVQEYIELRCNDRTVKITNSSRYVAEDSTKIIRTARVNKLAGHRKMYQSIVSDLESKLLCDTQDQIRITHQTMISLEQKIF